MIKFNASSGVSLDSSAGTGNMNDPNIISANGKLGIDLGGSGTPLPNDPGDGDTEPHNLQNFPEFGRVGIASTDGTLSIVYRFDFTPGNSNYGSTGLNVEFFLADGSLSGQTFIGRDFYTAADYNNDANIGNRNKQISSAARRL